jgi:hypothetical protein
MNAELTTATGRCEMCSGKADPNKLLIVFKGQLSGRLCPDHFAQVVKMAEQKKD